MTARQTSLRCATFALLCATACGPGLSDGADGAESDSDVGSAGSSPATGPAGTGTSGTTEPDEPGSSGSPGPDCDTSPPGECAHAFALRYGDFLDVAEEDGGNGNRGGPGIDPDTLVVIITTGSRDCGNPWGDFECGVWTTSLQLAPELIPGSYGLSDELHAQFSVTGPPYGLDMCSFGGGTLSGVLDLTAVDETHVRGEIADAPTVDVDVNGPFDAEVCP